MDDIAPQTALVAAEADLQVALRGAVSLWASATTSESERRADLLRDKQRVVISFFRHIEKLPRAGVLGRAHGDGVEDQAGVAALGPHPRRRDGVAGGGAAPLRARDEQPAADALHGGSGKGEDGDRGGGRAATLPRHLRA
jgi:hypothetical protein